MKDDLAHRTGTGRLDLESHALEREREQRAGNRLINHIFTAVKAGRLYAPNNLGFKKPLDALMKALNDFFKTEEAVVLETYLHCLFLNREKVRTEFHNYTHTKFFIDILKNRGVEGLSFRRGLREEELKKFILLLAGVDGREAITLKGFQQRLSDQNISHISVTQFSAAAKRAAEEQLQNTRQFAKRTFFQCIYNFRGIVYKEKSEQKTYTKRVRRLVQLIVDLIAEDESYLIGLTTIKNHDDYVLNHSVNVSILSVSLGLRLGLEKKMLHELGLAGLFHDLGKTEIPLDILCKPSSLSPGELRVVEKHPYQSVEKLMEMKGLEGLPVRAMSAALEHHRKYDGSGYPKLSKRRELDLFSRIVTIADCYDAATTADRPFRPKALKPDEALIDMIGKRGAHYDPLLLKVFVNLLGIYPIGTLVVLDTRELAIVVQTNSDPAYLDRPKVKLITDTSGNKVEEEIVDLTDIDPITNNHKKTILKSLDPQEYGIHIPKYF